MCDVCVYNAQLGFCNLQDFTSTASDKMSVQVSAAALPAMARGKMEDIAGEFRAISH